MKPSLVEEEEEEEEEEEGAILLHWEDLIVHLLPHILNRMPTAASEVVQPLRDGQTPKTNHLAWLGGRLRLRLRLLLLLLVEGYSISLSCPVLPCPVVLCCVVTTFCRIFKATII